MERYRVRRTGAHTVGARLITRAGIIACKRRGLFRGGQWQAANECVRAGLGDDELHRFVDAAHEIAAIRETMARRIAVAARLERRLLRARARRRIGQVLASHGLSHAQYRRIGAVLESDGGLGQVPAGGIGADGEPTRVPER